VVCAPPMGLKSLYAHVSDLRGRVLVNSFT